MGAIKQKVSPMVRRQIKQRLANGDTAKHLRQVYRIPHGIIEQLRLEVVLERQWRKVG